MPITPSSPCKAVLLPPPIPCRPQSEDDKQFVPQARLQVGPLAGSALLGWSSSLGRLAH